jgi:hypothetical protein
VARLRPIAEIVIRDEWAAPVGLEFAFERDHTSQRDKIYALALLHLFGIKLFDIKCAWFNENGYYEVFHRTLLSASPRLIFGCDVSRPVAPGRARPRPAATRRVRWQPRRGNEAAPLPHSAPASLSARTAFRIEAALRRIKVARKLYWLP